MALTWDMSAIPADRQLPPDRTVTDIIFATMAVGIGEITEGNYREFWTRLHTPGVS